MTTIITNSPCEECPRRNLICDEEQLKLSCDPWQKFSKYITDMLIKNRQSLPKLKRRWRVFKNM